MITFNTSQLPSGSYSISGSFSGSFQGDGSNLTGLPSAVNTGSLLVTASVSSNVITFTKGNGTTFPITISSSSFALTASYTPNYVLNSATSSFVNNNQTSSFVQNSQTSSMTVLSSSFASTASYINTLNQNLSIFGNLSVFGTASFIQITGSVLQVGTNVITLNTDNPGVRFGGISVVDSGSFGTLSTGSLLWDSQNNRWVYSNPSGSTYDGGLLISGPRNTSGLGNESGMDANFVAVGQGADHIQPGTIYNSGSITIVTGSLTATQGITGSLFGTASWSSNAVTASFAPNYVLMSVTSSMLSSYVLNSQTSSFVTNAVTASMLQPYVLNASTSSMSVLSSSFASTASYISPTFISASAAASGFGSGGSSGITVGSTTITSGTSGRIAFNNAGVYGESSGLTWDNTNKQIISSTNAIYEYPIIATRETNSAALGGGIKLNAYDASNASVPYASFISRIENNSSTPSVRKGGFSLRVFNNTSAVTGNEGLDDAIIGYSDKRIGIGGVNSYSNCAMQINTNTTTSGVFIFGASTSSRILLGRGVSTGEFAQLQYNASTDNLIIGCSNNLTNQLVLTNAGRNIGMSVTTPTALLHLAAGTATANTAPLKLTSGTNLTTPESGSIEYNGTNLFFTPSSTRNILAQISGSTALSTGQIPFATTNGYLTSTSNLFWDNTNNRLNIGTSSPAYSIGSLWIQGNNTSGSFSRNSVVINTANQTSMSEIMLTTNAVNSTVTCLRQYGTSSDFPFTIYGINPQGYGHLFSDNTKGFLISTNTNNTFIGIGAGVQNTASNLFFWGGASGVSIKNGTTTATAYLHLGAGTATAGTAPLKLTSGTNLTTPEAGSIEYNGTNLFFTPSSTRNILAQVTGSTALSSSQIPFATTNGYLTSTSNLTWDNINNSLIISSSLITAVRITQTNSGSFVVYSIPTASYDTAFFEYSIKSGSNARAGAIMAIQSGSNVNFTETTTTDFGDTTGVSFTVIVTGSNMALTGSSTTGAWTIKSIVRNL